MDAVAENLANVNSAGYLSERAQITASPSGDSTGIGSGAEVLGISQATDAVLSANSLAASATSANLSALQQSLSTIQAIFPEPGPNGLSSQLSTFWSSWDAVAANPSAVAPRTEVVNQAQNLTATLNQQAAQLRQTAANTNTAIATTVSHVNSLLGQVASLNQSIVSTIAAGSRPNTLIDQRNNLLNQLGQAIGITSRAQPNGSVNLYIGGMAVVQGNAADSLSVNQGGVPTTTSIVSVSSNTQVQVSGGTVAGLMAVVNTTLPGFQAQLDKVAQVLVGTVNAQLGAGYDAAGAPGTANPLFTGTGAGNIGVNTAVSANPALLAGASHATNGANDGSNAQALAELGSSPTGPDQIYRTFITDLGSQVQSATSQSHAQTSLAQSLQATLQSVTGVNIDQQTVEMLGFQQAYQASAKVISTVTAMMQSLLAAT